MFSLYQKHKIPNPYNHRGLPSESTNWLSNIHFTIWICKIFYIFFTYYKFLCNLYVFFWLWKYNCIYTAAKVTADWCLLLLFQATNVICPLLPWVQHMLMQPIAHKKYSSPNSRNFWKAAIECVSHWAVHRIYINEVLGRHTRVQSRPCAGPYSVSSTCHFSTVRFAFHFCILVILRMAWSALSRYRVCFFFLHIILETIPYNNCSHRIHIVLDFVRDLEMSQKIQEYMHELYENTILFYVSNLRDKYGIHGRS